VVVDPSMGGVVLLSLLLIGLVGPGAGVLV
jgi:hypothetical protein